MAADPLEYTMMDNDCADDDDYQSSADSSQGFSFSTSMDLRKNLTETFDKEVLSKPSMSSKMSTSSSVGDRIAQFEAATTAAKPPLPLKQQSNAVPANRVAVYLRIRPPLASSKDKNKDKTAPTSSVTTNTIDVLKPKYPIIHPVTVRTYPPAQSNSSKINLHRENHDSCAKEFEFHQVLEPESTQKMVYSTVAAPMIQSLFDSTTSTATNNNKSTTAACESALLFSYGITNAGKTHTMLGDIKSSNDAKWGVIPRAISDIFDHMTQLPKTAGHFDLYLSYFEIYNELIYDLIPKKSASNKNLGPPPALKVRERQGQTIVRGLTKHKVRDIEHGIELTLQASNRRHTSSNNLNSVSSRSHCVCQMQLVPRSKQAAFARPADDDASVVSMSGYSTDEEVSMLGKQKASTIWIVDLAGSERSKRTGMGSARQKEASQINQSLMTLMRCLTVMREKKSALVVPFRESKLTHVFMSHLTGPSASRTAMIVNVNPSVTDFDETQHVLAYASQAKMIKMNPEELSKKRKLYFGAEYDMDGRKKTKLNSASESTKRMATRIAKKLSPKKLAKKLSPKKMFRSKAKERKHATTKASNTVPKVIMNEPALKRMKHPPANSSSSSNANVKEVASLTTELQVTQAEVEVLRSEKLNLVEELNQQESQIRLEVSQEMEEQLRLTRERYNAELERLRFQITSNPMPCRSTRKAQLDRTEKHMEELMDKVNECEEEMVRMREEHTAELTQMRSRSEEEVAALKTQLRDPDKKPTSFGDHHPSKRIADLEKELEASRKTVERLEKSKVELVENYEQLLQEADDEGADEDSEEETVTNHVPLWKQKLLRSRANTSKSKITRSPPRQPLGTISGNVVDNLSDEENGKQQWIFPKKTSSRDTTGTYKRPSGRAPQDREWDASVGAWKLNVA